jgi:hypothetical protein
VAFVLLRPLVFSTTTPVVGVPVAYSNDLPSHHHHININNNIDNHNVEEERPPHVPIVLANDNLQHTHMSRVSENVFVGNFHAALDMMRNAQSRQQFNISAVVNVAWDFDMPTEEGGTVGSLAASNLHHVLRCDC